MDIASRLRAYMDAKNIASSQFADSADIPRPTLSQLLNGRNKKISNELIGKIHEAYPSLNVMWLMFGEGGMENNSNIQFSQPQNRNPESANALYGSDYNPIAKANTPDYEMKPLKQFVHEERLSTRANAEQNEERPISVETMQAFGNIGSRTSDTARVQQIMVLYTDGRFETFKPSEP